MVALPTSQCPACGSKRLARGHVATTGWRWPLAFFEPGGALGLGKKTSPLRAAACADCGRVQLIATELEAIGDLLERERRGSLRLED